MYPVYWFPYYFPDYCSLSDSPSDNDYSYTESATTPSQSAIRTANPGPVVVVINQGQPAVTDSSMTGVRGSNYRATAPESPLGAVTNSSEEKTTVVDSFRPVSPITQAAQASSPVAQNFSHPGNSGKLVLVSWLNDGGRDIIYAQNTLTNEVQKITSEPNLDNFRIVEVHPNSDPKEFEVIVANGKELIPVRFRSN
ncbi:MAG: hypothetical protein JOY96_05940 [Verrucomicrobia bacterium]|nr:hypothetical protein [Verrucomicrobiota bacterium]